MGIPINYIQAHLLFPQWQCSIKSPITIGNSHQLWPMRLLQKPIHTTIQQWDAMIGKPIIISSTLLKTHTMGTPQQHQYLLEHWGGGTPQHRKPTYASLPQNRSMLCQGKPFGLLDMSYIVCFHIFNGFTNMLPFVRLITVLNLGLKLLFVEMSFSVF